MKIPTKILDFRSFCVELWTKQVWYGILVPMSYISLLDVNIRHPGGVQKASQRRPRASKKRPGGAKLDLVVFYSVFKRPQSTGRHTPGSRNNLPVREVNRTIIFTNTNSSAKSTAYGTHPNTHWCARGHGADLKAKASCRRLPKI